MTPWRTSPRPLDTGPWCSCGLHRAMSAGGLCPTCLDEKAKKR